MSGEASSKADITIPGQQREMLSRLKEAGKTVIAVLMNGRPLALGWEAENIPVIIEGWHLGIEMGNALAGVIFGDVNPSGKLSSTFSSMNGQEPLYYNHPNTGRPGSKSKFTSKYLDAPVEPCFPFGYGMSYTTFEYSDLKLEESEDELQAVFTVKNTGKRAGTEVAQLYMQDVCGSLVRPVKELKNYVRVELAAGEAKEITLSLRKCDMGFYDNQGKYLLEDGLYRIYVGGNSRDCLMEEIRVKF
jgi:beta-glucosidase